MKRITGLDSIRFICATFVLIGHIGFPLPSIFTDPDSNDLLQKSGKLLGLIFNGPAAVIVFFIISGFCIHYPTYNRGAINLRQFYTRRLLRIGIPAIIAAFFYIGLKVDLNPPQFGIFWSIICETIYYTIYPVLLYLNKNLKVRWSKIVLFGYTLSLILLLANEKTLVREHNAYPALGLLTWLVGLPCWTLGCWLAENYKRFRLLKPIQMNGLRILVLVMVTLLRILKFHVTTVFASNCYTLNIFAFIACAWLGFEIVYYQTHKAIRIFEWAGTWSYSLYMMHPPTFALVILLAKSNPFSRGSIILLCFFVSYIFFLLIEKPSHQLALYLSSYNNKTAKQVPLKAEQ